MSFNWLYHHAGIVLVTTGLFVYSSAVQAFNGTPRSAMPESISNNAVTQVVVASKSYLLSFSGLSAKKTYQDVHNKAFAYDVINDKWQRLSPVPLSADDAALTNGLTGRLASVATSIGSMAYIFGGYTVAKDHTEVSISDVYSYNLARDHYQLLTPMPVPVDDSVALSYQNKFIYLVSGWHNSGNVNLVQLYNTQTNSWSQATPFPGKPVFGHAGGIVSNNMLICDGVAIKFHKKVRRTYQDEAACYLGIINEKNPNLIDWRVVKHPTGDARYRMAGTGLISKNEIVFIGGSDNPYNYNGVGYNGERSLPSNQIWYFDLATKKWNVEKSTTKTMDHRGLLILGDELITLGGMANDGRVLNSINVYPLAEKK